MRISRQVGRPASLQASGSSLLEHLLQLETTVGIDGVADRLQHHLVDAQVADKGLGAQEPVVLDRDSEGQSLDS